MKSICFQKRKFMESFVFIILKNDILIFFNEQFFWIPPMISKYRLTSPYLCLILLCREKLIILILNGELLTSALRLMKSSFYRF